MKLSHVSLFVMFLGLASCARDPLPHHFDFDVMLPLGGVRINEIFPYQIKQMRQRLTRLDLPENMFGMRASYGEDDQSEEISMTIIQARKAEDAADYYESKIFPVFKAMAQMKTPVDDWDRAIYARDKDGRQWLTWNNQGWIIELSGSDDLYFQTVVKACRFIDLLK